jgi:hypothetical protein
MGRKGSVAHDGMERGKGDLPVGAGRSDIGMLATVVLVELVVVQESHSVQEDRFGVALEAVAHHRIVAKGATWTRHSRFLHLDGPLRRAVRA